MDTMTQLRARFAVLLLAGAVCLPALAAELRLGTEIDTYYDTPLRLRVSLTAEQIDDAEYIRPNWFDELEWSVTEKSRGALPVRIGSLKPQPDQFVPGWPSRRPETKGRRQETRISEAKVVMEPLGVGDFEIQVRYRDKTAVLKLLFADPETDERAKDTQLRRESERSGLTWEEYRAIQMKRLDRHPGSWIIYWNLGWRSLRNVPMAEADGYFAKSIELERSFMEKLQASVDKRDQHVYKDQRAAYEYRERVTAAVRSLLPEYYKNRDDLWIVEEWVDSTGRDTHGVTLLEWPSKKIIRVIDCRPPKKDDETQESQVILNNF
ncbi:MAG: hypothetical protein ACSLFQ_21130 [Thermoanaerobaculia bacterium]